MKRVFFFVLAMMIALTACSSGTADVETTEATTTEATVSEVETVEEEVFEEVTEAEEEPAEPVVYDYSIVGDCYTVLTTGEGLLQSTASYQVTMWDFMGYSNDTDIESAFATSLDSSGSLDTLEQVTDLLPNIVSKYEASEYDPEMPDLMTTCVNEYYALNDLVVSPSGTYADYQVAWEAQTESYITAFDDMVAYLYEVGYFSDEE